jgi:hypothetical protein
MLFWILPEPTGDKVTDCVNEMKYELAVYDTAEHNAIFSETTPGIVKSNMMFKQIMKAICDLLIDKYSVAYLGTDINVYLNPKDLLVYESSDYTKFSRHIIPTFHVSNHLEAKAFIDAFVAMLDPSIHQVVDLGVCKSFHSNTRAFTSVTLSSTVERRPPLCSAILTPPAPMVLGGQCPSLLI